MLYLPLELRLGDQRKDLPQITHTCSVLFRPCQLFRQAAEQNRVSGSDARLLGT